MTWPSRLAGHLVSVAAGYVVDRLVGEPPERYHPLRAFGSLMSHVEDRFYRDTRAAGARYAATGAGLGLLAGLLLRTCAFATYLACGGRALQDAARSVDRLLVEGDLSGARSAARALVGRDVGALGEKELVRAAVESVAENTLDAVVAPVFFAALFGAPGVLVYRAANTLDAMVGYHNACYERFGWASARLDDALGFVPARLTVALVMLVRPRRAGRVLGAVRRDAAAHPSPNAGVVESAFAGALGVRLGGTNSYRCVAEIRPALGEGPAPGRGDIEAAVALSRQAGAAAALLALVGALALRVAPVHVRDRGRSQ